MNGYTARLDRLEEIIAPKRDCPHLVWLLNAEQTAEQAIAEYAERKQVSC